MISGVSVASLGVFIVILLISLAIHEATHAFVAHRLGDTTAAEEGRLTLNPLKHVDLFTTILLPVITILLGLPPILIAKPVPFDPTQVRYGEYGAALMAIAGPFSNLALAVLAAGLYHIGLVPVAFYDILRLFMQINITLFVFNMLPIPPLDGSRLLFAFAPEPLQRVMLQIEQMGFIVLIAILLLLASFIGPVISNTSQAIFTFLI